MKRAVFILLACVAFLSDASAQNDTVNVQISGIVVEAE